MNRELILWPVIAQVFLVVLLFVRLGRLKDRAKAAGVVDPRTSSIDPARCATRTGPRARPATPNASRWGSALHPDAI